MAVYSMKKNIIAILNHSVKAQDLSKQHRFCPPGENSWSKWQQDQATGTSTYKDDDCLPEVFLEVLRPTFMTLSETKLLERCVCGATQNQNKCINSLAWVRCPKHKHHGVKVIRCGVASAVLHFYGGAASREKVMQRLSIPAGAFTRRASLIRDKKRLQKSDLQASKKDKKRRRAEGLRKTRREDALREAEDTTYEAGAF